MPPLPVLAQATLIFPHLLKELTMWTKPTFIDMRLGLEVTLYISNR